MDVAELKQALVTRGLATSGAHQTLINRYLSSDPRTYSDEQLFHYISTGACDRSQNKNKQNYLGKPVFVIEVQKQILKHNSTQYHLKR